jgi:hypothetical protein
VIEVFVLIVTTPELTVPLDAHPLLIARTYIVPVLLSVYALVVGDVVALLPGAVSQYIDALGALYVSVVDPHAGLAAAVIVPDGVDGTLLTVTVTDCLNVLRHVPFSPCT